jgi:hypothetical protein
MIDYLVDLQSDLRNNGSQYQELLNIFTAE